MDEVKVLKLKAFIADTVMLGAVYEFLMETFLEEKGGSTVESLAVERLAINLLRSTWKELQKYQSKTRVDNVVSSNVGL